MEPGGRTEGNRFCLPCVNLSRVPTAFALVFLRMLVEGPGQLTLPEAKAGSATPPLPSALAGFPLSKGSAHSGHLLHTHGKMKKQTFLSFEGWGGKMKLCLLGLPRLAGMPSVSSAACVLVSVHLRISWSSKSLFPLG